MVLNVCMVKHLIDIDNWKHNKLPLATASLFYFTYFYFKHIYPGIQFSYIKKQVLSNCLSEKRK